MNFGKQLKEGLITQNPVLVQVLGMCSTMAITTSFLTLGALIAVMQWALAKSEKKKEAK